MRSVEPTLFERLTQRQAFKKVPLVDPDNKAKKGFIWVLDPSRVGVGIESTTRYRQKTVSKRCENDDQADPKRQRSGRKGGKAARRSAKLRLRKSRLLEHDAGYAPYPKIELSIPLNGQADGPVQHASLLENWDSNNRLPYYLTPPSSSTPPSYPEEYIYDYGATNENSPTQQQGTPSDQRDQTLLNHPLDSGCESLQLEGPDIPKLENLYCTNRLTTLS